MTTLNGDLLFQLLSTRGTSANEASEALIKLLDEQTTLAEEAQAPQAEHNALHELRANILEALEG